MARFSDVPLDMLPNVLEHLSQPDLNSLVRTCRSLHIEVTPWLYENITITATPSGNNSLRIEILLRTLIDRPLLASYTRLLNIVGSHNCWVESLHYGLRSSSKPALWGLEQCKHLSRSQLTSEAQRLEGILDPTLRRSAAKCHGRSKDVLATLILLRLKSLTTLKISDGFVTFSSFLANILKQLDKLLPHLTHIALGDRKQDSEKSLPYVDLDLIRPMFYASNIQSIEATIFDPWRFYWDHDTDEAPRALRLSSLRIHRTNVSLHTLYQLTSATPRLKSFHYEQELRSVRTYRLGRHTGLLHYNDLSGMDKVLSNVLETLEELHLSVRFAENYVCDVSPSTYPSALGCMVLKTMNRLRHLQLPMLMLLGWMTNQLTALEDILPPSIEELILSDDLVAHCPWGVGVEVRPKIRLIGEYMEERQTTAPDLRTLTIGVRTEHKEAWWLVDAVKDLQAWVNGDDIHHSITHDAGVETHLWQFLDSIDTT